MCIRDSSKGNPVAVGQAIDRARPQLDRPAVEGTIRFDDGRPVPVPSDPGHVVDGTAAPAVVVEHWLDPAPVALPVTPQAVSVTQEGIDTAMREIALPAVAAPAYVVGDGRNATLSPDEIGTFLRFDPDGSGGLRPRIDVPAAQAVVDRDLGATEAEPKDASSFGSASVCLLYTSDAADE